MPEGSIWTFLLSISTFMFILYVWYEHELRSAKTPYRFSITRIGSGVFTWLCYLWIPRFLRNPLYKLYSWKYSVWLYELENQNLKSYQTFAKFFTRQIRSKIREVEDKFDPLTLCSPCDGTVLSFGTIVDNQMKGAVKD